MYVSIAATPIPHVVHELDVEVVDVLEDANRANASPGQ
jgi:hypothetical protein